MIISKPQVQDVEVLLPIPKLKYHVESETGSDCFELLWTINPYYIYYLKVY
jgi:hypothetical protein